MTGDEVLLVPTAIVSCDVVGHGDAPKDVQRERLIHLNEIVRRVLEAVEHSHWASAGDGGHLLLPASTEASVIVRYVEALDEFQRTMDLALRVCFHAGPTGYIDGADGRRQPYGETINTAGHLVMLGDGKTMYATAPFIEWFEASGDEGISLRFSHDANVVYLKRGRPHTIYAAYVLGAPEAGPAVETDRTRLRVARESGQSWEVLYHARRLLQSDSRDVEAVQALYELRPAQLLLAAEGRDEAHPVFSALSASGIAELVRHSALVERDPGEYVCLVGDPGDAMFIVLKGEVGVVTPSQVQEAQLTHGTDAAANIRYGPGAIVGELALALHRERTASLQATKSCAVLAIDRAAFDRLTDEGGRSTLEHLLLSRTLEHVVRHAAYLAAPGGAPLADLPVPWAYLESSAELLTISVDAGQVLKAEEDYFARPGVYILASGELVEESSRDTETPSRLVGVDFPLIWVNLPRHIRRTSARYVVEASSDQNYVAVLRISDDAILRRVPHDRRSPLLAAFRRQVAQQMAFDVFLSYAGDFVHEATHLAELLANHGVKVCFQSTVDRGRRGNETLGDFRPELVRGIRESIVFVGLVSSGSANAEGTAWMQREIALRSQVYPSGPNILPVVYERGVLDEVADGFQAINAVGSIESGRAELVDTVTHFVSRCRSTGDGLPLDRGGGEA